MRAFILSLVLVALLLVSVSGVSVPYKSCGSSSDDATVTSIDSNEFPPVKGDTLSLNVTGNLSKEVTSGTYTIAVTVGGFPLPDITGDISAFRALPWPVGDLNFTYSQGIPSAAPSGSYTVKISAVDQDSTRIFCVSIAFSLKAETESDVLLQYISNDNSVSHPQSVDKVLPVRNVHRMQSITNRVQRIKQTEMKMNKLNPFKGNRRV